MSQNHFDRAAKHKARDHAAADLQRLLADCACPECQDAKGWLESSEALNKSQVGDIERRANSESVLDILNRLQSRGLLSTQQAQMAAAQLAVSVRPMFSNAKG
jgi:hypothetical protein